MTLRDGTRVDVALPIIEDDGAHVPHFYLELNAEQAYELQFGRVPGEVREMARLLIDETQEMLRKNAAKPEPQQKPKKKARTR